MKSIDRFSKNHQVLVSNFIRISLVVSELFHPEGQTDRHDRTKLVVAVRNFTSRHKINLRKILYNKSTCLYFQFTYFPFTCYQTLRLEPRSFIATQIFSPSHDVIPDFETV